MKKEELIQKAYEIAVERYAAVGVDTEQVLKTMQDFHLDVYKRQTLIGITISWMSLVLHGNTILVSVVAIRKCTISFPVLITARDYMVAMRKYSGVKTMQIVGEIRYAH